MCWCRKTARPFLKTADKMHRSGRGSMLLWSRGRFVCWQSILPYHFANHALYACKRRGFRLCGGDQRAFRSPFGNLRAHTLLKCLQARPPLVFSSWRAHESASSFAAVKGRGSMEPRPLCLGSGTPFQPLGGALWANTRGSLARGKHFRSPLSRSSPNRYTALSWQFS